MDKISELQETTTGSIRDIFSFSNNTKRNKSCIFLETAVIDLETNPSFGNLSGGLQNMCHM